MSGAHVFTVFSITDKGRGSGGERKKLRHGDNERVFFRCAICLSLPIASMTCSVPTGVVVFGAIIVDHPSIDTTGNCNKENERSYVHALQINLCEFAYLLFGHVISHIDVVERYVKLMQWQLGNANHCIDCAGVRVASLPNLNIHEIISSPFEEITIAVYGEQLKWNLLMESFNRYSVTLKAIVVHLPQGSSEYDCRNYQSQ